MTTSIAEAILQGANQLRLGGVPEARREAGSLLAYVLDRDRSFILTHAADDLDQQHAEVFRGYLDRRAGGEPLQYITGRQDFFGRDFEVSRDVLIPRPETELLIETALDLLGAASEGPLICDVGTGSGCIAITLAQELARARFVAVDISPAAIAVATRNAKRHAVVERIDFLISDCFAALAGRYAAASFDLIVSNPPYVSESELGSLQREVREFEPRTALAAGEDGLAIIRRLLVESAAFLKTGGYLVFEIGFTQSDAVKQLIDAKTWELLAVHPDLQGIPRTVALRKVS
ncbi:MAG TPA: peptide chain release factor N(5)-glutamine methyltransferase [Pyrinomonadaceae bacterium]|jgi:release factor glutamine methyltransferase